MMYRYKVVELRVHKFDTGVLATSPTYVIEVAIYIKHPHYRNKRYLVEKEMRECDYDPIKLPRYINEAIRFQLWADRYDCPKGKQK